MYMLGATLRASRSSAKKSAEDLASQRRVYEAEMAQKDALAASADLQAKVVTWMPRIAIGTALIIAGYIFWKKRKGR